MALKYKLSENDFLQMQLFFFKDSNELKKITKKNLIVWAITLSVFISILLLYNEKFGAILVSIGAIISLLMYPKRIKGIYFKRLKNEAKLYQNKINNITTLEFNENYISIVGDSEFKTSISNIQRVIETNNHYFIQLNPEVVIIPKLQLKSQNELSIFTEKHNLKIENQLNWNW
jgi:hypothetical protein